MLRRVGAHPMQWRHVAARALGWVTTLPYRWRRNVHLGPRLLGNGRLRISGPGRVEVGADVNAWSHAEVNRLITTRQEAVIRIGRHARLNGCTIDTAPPLIRAGVLIPLVSRGHDIEVLFTRRTDTVLTHKGQIS